MDKGLKQRIIGALVLVVAAVVFLPMLLSGQDETEQVEVTVPEAPVLDDREIAVAVPPTLPEPAPVPVIPQPAAEPVEEPAVTPLPDTASIEPAPVVTTPAEPVAEPVPAPAPAEPAAAPAPTAGGWVIQQASFSSIENAESFRKTLAGQGYNAYTRSAQTDGKTIVRVYVGPLESREAAARVRDELQRRHQNKGLILAQDDSNRSR